MFQLARLRSSRVRARRQLRRRGITRNTSPTRATRASGQWERVRGTSDAVVEHTPGAVHDGGPHPGAAEIDGEHVRGARVRGHELAAGAGDISAGSGIDRPPYNRSMTLA